MKLQHTCPCGGHQHPGEILVKTNGLLVIRVMESEFVFIEVRRVKMPTDTDPVCAEPLVSAMMVPLE